MVVTIQLVVEPDSAEELEVSSQIDLSTAAPGWQAELLAVVADRAREAASCLVRQLPEPAVACRSSFVPLHSIVPAWK